MEFWETNFNSGNIQKPISHHPSHILQFSFIGKVDVFIFSLVPNLEENDSTHCPCNTPTVVNKMASMYLHSQDTLFSLLFQFVILLKRKVISGLQVIV